MEKVKSSINKNSSTPIARQVAQALREAIVEKRFSANEKLPSADHLAKELAVSRCTILTACKELASTGYLNTIPGRGSYVAGALPMHPASQLNEARQDVVLSKYGQQLLANCILPDCDRIDAAQSLDSTPLSTWQSLLKKHAQMRDASLLSYDANALGHSKLREAYLSYLTRTRAISASLEQLFVFPARELRLNLLCQILLEPGDMVAVENPGYSAIRLRLRTNGARLFPVPVDQEGMDVDYLINSGHPIKLVYVTPSHHEPTGAVLSMPRRRRLLDWAASTGALIIEDDYDSEFRYGSQPLPSLQSMDNSDSTIFISCLWKILSPVVKIGFVVVPKRLTQVMVAAKALVERDLPMVEQFVLADFIAEGHLERHISRLRSRYASRRQALLEALQQAFGAKVTVAQETAGTDLLVRFNLRESDADLLAHAHESGLAIFSSAQYYIDEPVQGEFVIPFANCTEQSLIDGVRLLSERVAY